jgi:hypothetical protein
MYTHVNSSLQGIATIRAFNLEQILIQEFTIHQVSEKLLVNLSVNSLLNTLH